jgi:regulator of replication initiation timing
MSESQVFYSARQVTEALDCSPQMAGKYFQAFEKITKTKIKTHGRDGRQFDSPTRDVLVVSRDIVRSNNGVTVEDAVRRALSLSQIPLEVELSTNTQGLQAQQLIDALRASQEPLLNELRDIKLELQALRARDTELKQPQTTQEKTPSAREETEHGLLVRLALWVERSVGRRQ